MHALIFVSSLIVWMPLLSPLPEVPRLQPLVRMLFLFLQSIVPTVPASFLTFGDAPALLVLRHTCRACGASRRSTTCRSPGSIMKIGVGFTLWVIIAIIFFRWYNAEEIRTPSPAGVARPRPRADGIAAAMTDDDHRRRREAETEDAADRDRRRPSPRSSRAASRARAVLAAAAYVERYLVPLVAADRRWSSAIVIVRPQHLARVPVGARPHPGRSSASVITVADPRRRDRARRTRRSMRTVVDRVDDRRRSCSSMLVGGLARARALASGRTKAAAHARRRAVRRRQTIDVIAAPGGELKFAPDEPRRRRPASTAIDARRTPAPAAHARLRRRRPRCSPGSGRRHAGETADGADLLRRAGRRTPSSARSPATEAAGMEGIVTVTGPTDDARRGRSAAGDAAPARAPAQRADG